MLYSDFSALSRCYEIYSRSMLLFRLKKFHVYRKYSVKYYFFKVTETRFCNLLKLSNQMFNLHPNVTRSHQYFFSVVAENRNFALELYCETKTFVIVNLESCFNKKYISTYTNFDTLITYLRLKSQKFSHLQYIFPRKWLNICRDC